MADRLHKNIPDGPVGESWEVSAHPNGLSRVAGGPFAGLSLAELAKRARRLEGFPRGKTEAWYIIERLPRARRTSFSLRPRSPRRTACSCRRCG